MSNADLARIRKHYESLHDDGLIRTTVIEGWTLVPAAQEVVLEVVARRLGSASALVERERASVGRFWGRVQPVRTFDRLRGPLEPVLGGRDVSPTDGAILLTDRGLGFVPSTPPPARELFPELPPALPAEGPIGEWLQELLAAAKVPAPERDARFVYRLPLSLRARLDPTAAWIPRESLRRLELHGPELRVVVEGAGDAVCRVDAAAAELLGRWAGLVDVELDEREEESVKGRVKGWLRRD